MEKQLTNKRNSARPQRTPLNGRKRLSVRNRDPGYHYRIVNTNLERDPERVQDFLDAGWEVVPADQAGQVGDKQVDNPSALGSAGNISVGRGTKAIVMRIRQEWYDEDQALKEAERKETEQAAKKSADYGSLDITVKRTID